MRCARCLRQYSSHSLTNDWWCANDRALFCAKCLSEESACPFCGRKTKGTAGVLLLQGTVFLTMGLIAAALFLPGAYAGTQLNEMPTTSVAHLPGSGTVKVTGTVGAGQGSVIVVFLYHDSAGTETGRHVRDFWLNESSGSVLVRMGSDDSSSPSIVRGGQEYPANVSGPGFQYESGDEISVIGVVSNSPDGPAVIAQEVAPGPHVFSTRSFPFDAELFGALLSIPSAAVVAGLAIGSHRVRLHTARLPLFEARRPKALSPAPASDTIAWRVETSSTRMYRLGLAGLAIAAGAAVAFLVVVVSPIPFSTPVYNATFFATPVVGLFATLFGFVSYSGGRAGILRIGTSRSGVYAEYRKRPKYAPKYVAWRDVDGFEGPLPMNPKAFRLDTPFGKEYFQGVGPATIAAVRTAFESSRAVSLPSGTVVRPTVESLRGAVLPARLEAPTQTKNRLPTRWYRWCAVLAAVQVALLPLAVLLVERVGINQGLVALFFPGLAAISLFRAARQAPRAVQVSESGFEVESAASVRSVAWGDIAELAPFNRGFRFRTRSATVDTVPLVDRAVVVEVVDGLRRARGFGPPSTPAAWAGPPDWLENSVSFRSRRWLGALLGLPAAAMAVSAAVLWLSPSNVEAIIGLALPVAAVVFALFPWVIYRAAPVRVSAGAGEIVAEYRSRVPELGVVQSLPLGEIDRIMAPGEGGIAGAGSVSLPGLPTRALAFRTVTGLVLTLGPISPELEQKVLLRLTPAQRPRTGAAPAGLGPSAPR